MPLAHPLLPDARPVPRIGLPTNSRLETCLLQGRAVKEGTRRKAPRYRKIGPLSGMVPQETERRYVMSANDLLSLRVK